MSRDDAPFVLSGEELPEDVGPGPAEAPPLPDEPPSRGAAMTTVTRLAARRRPALSGWVWSVAGLLLSLVISITAYEYIAGLMQRIPGLGTAVLVLTCLLAGLLVIQIVREWLAFRRLARIDGFRREAAAVVATGDHRKALELSERLEGFYAGRGEVAWNAETLARQRGDLLDADAVLHLTEQTLFAPLDAQARLVVESGTRSVAGATALVPLALLDVMAALSINIRMIRGVADVYGAHAGFFGSWRLLRSVVTHLIATGVVAVGDDMIGGVAGGHALSKVSRRFGEGMINGVLTARVGVAAMEVCRPLPFAAVRPPRVSSLVGRSVTGLFAKNAD